ncbi:DNA-directed RNA polymerase subunit beta', partial [bacterium]|nr:DNA-directed RNA polymerase subunit beta' [bacterium]
LKGKQGRFRQNLLGKRVDYSGRSVIVVGPELKINQCGLPKRMALQLFEPFIIRELKQRGAVHTVRSAKKLIERGETEVWDILEQVTKGHPVLLNRAPTLHRLGIQAFEPVLIEGSAIRIHPLVCHAFNADFDGDQMAVHVPLSKEAMWETKNIMLATNNIFSPASGKPIMTPTQDIVLGIYYLTRGPWLPEHQKPKVGVLLPEEVARALDNKAITLHTEVKIMFPGEQEPMVTTAGRFLFNEALPDELPYYNEPVDKKRLGQIIMECYKTVGREGTIKTLDAIKQLGFHEACMTGISISISDLVIPKTKDQRLKHAHEDVAKVTDQYKAGVITENERYNMIIDIWTHANEELGNDLIKVLADPDQANRELNPVHMMIDSGARGSKQQIRQLAAMRGLMAKPSGEIIETPITSNFKEGLSVLEYFVSTHGARKGLADTALKTADAGYLTRRLVDVAHDVIITEDDCGTPNGIGEYAIEEGNQVVVPLADRIVGRTALLDIKEPGTSRVIVAAGEVITVESADEIEDLGIETVDIRSALTCQTPYGICAKCYGMDLARQRLVELGTPVGIIAAQSIGEPGTQLTMRTFHYGGTASSELAQPFHRAEGPGAVKLHNVRTVETKEGKRALNKNGFLTLHDKDGKERFRYGLVIGALLLVEDGDQVKKGQTLVKWDQYSIPIYSEARGLVEYHEIIEGVTMTRERNESTGQYETIILESRENLHPQIILKDPDNPNEPLGYYPIPANAHIVVENGELVAGGQLIAKTPRKASTTKDIVGGLPRVEELFEARRPKDLAEIAKINGVIEFAEGLVRGHRKVVVRSETTGEEIEHLIPLGRHLIVTRNERVQKGQPLTEGSVDAHELLDICGVKEVQRYLLDQIQEVYRCQGVEINDKHIETIIRQMLRKVQITEPGDTRFLYDDVVDRRAFEQENRRVRQLDPPGRPANGSYVLQGVTKAGLSTASFISAASFQETTRVLTEAACTGRTDYLLGFKENIIMGHVVPSGTGFSSERIRKGFENSEELYVGRITESETPGISVEEEEEEDTALAAVESIIQGVSGYAPEQQESESEESES